MSDLRPPTVDTFPAGVPDGDTVVYGPDIDDEASLRLLGQVEGRRILELGVGSGRNAVALALQGAKVIAVDPDPHRLDAARQLADRRGVRVEFHEAELADIAFVRADTVDLVVSVHALAGVDDPDRVFRQAHRVLRPETPLVLSVPHPAIALVAGSPAGAVTASGHGTLSVTRSWFDTSPLAQAAGPAGAGTRPMTYAGLTGGLFRAGFRVEVVLEPEPVPSANRSAWWHDAMQVLPGTMVVRARKLGV
jgi:SAM-dependent methyltransferase